MLRGGFWKLPQHKEGDVIRYADGTGRLVVVAIVRVVMGLVLRYFWIVLANKEVVLVRCPGQIATNASLWDFLNKKHQLVPHAPFDIKIGHYNFGFEAHWLDQR